MTALRAAALTLSVLFNPDFFAFILSPSSSSAYVTCSFAFTISFFFTFFSFVFILFSSVITVALATGSKPGISTHLVPSDLKLDGAGKAKAYVCVYVHEEVNAHLWSLTLTPSQQPSAWEVELGDQRPSLLPRELRVSSVYLVLRWSRSWTRRE